MFLFFEMRFDFGTLDSGERSLPFGLLVFSLREIEVICVSIFAGLPFPSRQSFRVILLLEPFQLMSKFTIHRLDILK